MNELLPTINDMNMNLEAVVTVLNEDGQADPQSLAMAQCAVLTTKFVLNRLDSIATSMARIAHITELRYREDMTA